MTAIANALSRAPEALGNYPGERLLSLGAKMVQEEPNCIGSHCLHLMADPEGNEFCVFGD